MEIWMLFLLGLTSGGVSCLAMQGGLLASLIINQKQKFVHATYQTISLFLASKLLFHTIAGFLLGLLGSKIAISLEVRIFFQVLAGLFMLATALNLLNAHPIFRYVVIQPPKFIYKLLRKLSKSSEAFFAPILLGALTIFIPCGATQSVQIAAASSANPWFAALMMFAFVLGTAPLFFILGVTTSKLTDQWQSYLKKAAALILIAISAYFINSALVVYKPEYSVQNLLFSLTNKGSYQDQALNNNLYQTPMKQAPAPQKGSDVSQKITISVLNNGYSPRHLLVNQNVPVELTLKSNNTYSCALAFVFREFNINTMLQPNDTQVFHFTPNKKGRFTFTCSMGMYSGVLEVI